MLLLLETVMVIVRRISTALYLPVFKMSVLLVIKLGGAVDGGGSGGGSAGSTNHSVGGECQRHVVSVTVIGISTLTAAEMVRTTATRLVRNPFATTALGQGGTSFVVHQASSATIIPSATCVRRNTPAAWTVIEVSSF
jgi:hypothetical protein